MTDGDGDAAATIFTHNKKKQTHDDGVRVVVLNGYRNLKLATCFASKKIKN